MFEGYLKLHGAPVGSSSTLPKSMQPNPDMWRVYISALARCLCVIKLWSPADLPRRCHALWLMHRSVCLLKGLPTCSSPALRRPFLPSF